MAVLIEQVLPEGVTPEFLDEVTSELRADEDRPKGMFLHTHFMRSGRTHSLDIWESSEAEEAFRAERLLPAMQKVASRQGLELGDAQPETIITELHRVVTGSALG